MKRKTIVGFVTVLLLCGTAAYGQSLADLAKKEKERREQVKKDVKVITNVEAAKFHNVPVTVAAQPPSVPEGKMESGKDADAADKAAAKKPANDEPTDLLGRPESFWRQTMADARKKIKDLENDSNVLILKLNDLQNQFYRESNGFKQQDIQAEIQKTLYEQSVNKENLEKAKDALADLEKEARKSGALPGWLTAREPQ